MRGSTTKTSDLDEEELATSVHRWLVLSDLVARLRPAPTRPRRPTTEKERERAAEEDEDKVVG